MIDSNAVFNIKSEEEFSDLALEIFKFQFENNSVYRSFCDLLYKHPSDVKRVEDIPFLPIQFFKSHKVVTSEKAVQKIFKSSGTTGDILSHHYLTDLSVYERSFQKGFTHFYGDPKNYVILALLPAYLEREDSSLVYMANALIQQSKHPESGFYLDNYEQLNNILVQLDKEGRKILLLGVSFALLDLIEQNRFSLNNTIIMETGGMKGRRKEMIREALHTSLKSGFGVSEIHSEYGMTELLSQAYSKGDGIFKCPPWMKIIVRNTYDAMSMEPIEKTGGVNIIDLANLNSCSFIASQDLGKVHKDGSFEVLGRFDHSDIRGCNLMML